MLLISWMQLMSLGSHVSVMLDAGYNQENQCFQHNYYFHTVTGALQPMMLLAACKIKLAFYGLWDTNPFTSLSVVSRST